MTLNNHTLAFNSVSNTKIIQEHSGISIPIISNNGFIYGALFAFKDFSSGKEDDSGNTSEFTTSAMTLNLLTPFILSSILSVHEHNNSTISPPISTQEIPKLENNSFKSEIITGMVLSLYRFVICY